MYTRLRRAAVGRWRIPLVVLAVLPLVGLLVLPSASGGDPATAATARPAQSNEPPPHEGPPDVLPSDGSWTVTLLTGEVVEVSSDTDGRVSARVEGNEGGLRTIRRPDGRLYVIPYAATPLLVDTLDLELFNVTGLIQQGYDDESTDSIGLIVQREPGEDLPGTFDTAEDEQPLPSIDAVALSVPKSEAEATGEEMLSAGAPASDDPLAGVTRVWLDRRITTAGTTTLPAGTAMPPGTAGTAWSAGAGVPVAPVAPDAPVAPGQDDPRGLDPNLTQIGADRAWEAGFTGEGVTVAVLDTGIDGDHPDLAGEVVAEENFSLSDTVEDRHGHGTHVAAVAAGTGASADGARQGVAPDAALINGKVLDDGGGGSESDLIAGMEWASPQADIVNMSLGAQSWHEPGDDPVAQAVDSLSEEHGTLFVVAAGNSGPLSGSVDTPGIADAALTVGAVDTDDRLAEFSGRGPLPGTFAMKPEVVAPGVDIVAARAGGTNLGDPADDTYTALSGTSMATPHVAGAAAVLREQHPDWGYEELRRALTGSADAIDGDGYDVGSGRLDIGDGVGSTLTTDRHVVQASLPYPRSGTHEETVSWSNLGDDPLTVEVGATLADRDGDPVDSVAVEPAELTIAPGESSSATVRVDGPGLDTGLYSGSVTATVDADDVAEGVQPQAVRTPLGIHAEGELVEITIEATPPTDAADGFSGLVAVTNLDDFGLYDTVEWFGEHGLTLTVPAGRYSVLGDVQSSDWDAQVVAQVGEADVSITDDTTLTLDAGAAEPFDPTVEGVATAPPMFSTSSLLTVPARGAGGYALVWQNHAWYPNPPLRLTAIAGDPEVFAADHVFRLQEPHLTAHIGSDPVEVVEASYESQRPQFPAGEQALTVVDAGDGSDLSGAQGALAVVQLPDDFGERTEIVDRAAGADVAVLTFVDENRPHLTLSLDTDTVPVIAAAGGSASRLLAAGRAGEVTTITSAASPFVYDIVGDLTSEVIVAPVLDETAQAGLATLEETFHRDSDTVGPRSDRRYTLLSDLSLQSEGPLPTERAAYVTPGVRWDSGVLGPGHIEDYDGPQPYLSVLLSLNAGEVYEPGETYDLTWLRRPQWPGAVGLPPEQRISVCQPWPVTRTPWTLQVWLAPFQDGRDRFGCSEPTSATLTLERDGELVDSVDYYAAEFTVPEEPGTYTLTYEQEGASPYPHRSHTTWTFGSEASDGRVPLLVVDYELPLDAMNRPTHDEGVLSVQQVTGSEEIPVEQVEVWTSVDGGETWDPARVQPEGDGTYEVTLPELEDDLEGASVSLRVEARDEAGNEITQILYDAYTG